MTKASKNDNVVLEKILYIYYLIWFKENKVWALSNLNSEVNTMTPGYTSNLGLKIYSTNIIA